MIIPNFAFKHPKVREMKHIPTILPTLALTLLAASCQENFDSRLQREAKEYTAKHCPEPTEEGSTLDSLTYDPTSHIYALHFSIDGTNEAIYRENEPILHHQLIQRVQTDDNTKALRKHAVNYKFVYRSATTHQVIYETLITPQEYAQH